MGVKHSTRRELLVDGSAGAGDSAAIDCSSTRRSSSCKGRSRRSKIARSHSDRTPTSLSVNVLQYGDAATTNGTQDSSIAVVCSAVSTSSQTCVQSISVMTQTEPDELLEWRMIDDDCCDLMPDSPSKQVNVGNISNFDCSRTPDYRMSVDRELHCFRQECARCVRLMKAKSSSCDKDNCQPAVCCDDKIKDSSCSSYSKINPVCGTAGCSPTETDRIYSAVDISKPESNTISESGGITDVQKQITETNVDADVLKQLDKRKLSYSYECNSGGKRLSECMRVSQMECTNYRKNTVDLGSSFASLNSEDMMLDSERDDMMSPSNISSRQSSVEAGSLAYSHRSSNLTSSKFTAVPESCDYAGYQVNDNNNKAALRDGDSGVRKNFERVHNDAVADDFKRAVNGWIGLDPVSEVSPDDVFCRFVVLIVPLNNLHYNRHAEFL